MTASIAAPPRLYRQPERGLLGGVASGIADHVGISLKVVRLAFVVLACGGGLGIALYGAYWIVLPTAPGAPVRGRLPAWADYVIATVGVFAAIALAVTSFPHGGLFIPALLACLGGALIWRQARPPDRARLRSLPRTFATGLDSRQGRARLALGGALVVAGGVIVLAGEGFTAIRDGLLAIGVTIVGLALITGPWWINLVVQLSDERAERIRTQERADIAAHLHDSVLQTLALIQRNAASPREVARLARGQERDLRAMLYDEPTAGQFAAQLRADAGAVEDAYAISVDVVVVGDAALDDQLRAVAGATREALVNAGKHSGAAAVVLYAEVEDDEVSVFVKDRGKGFEMAGIGEDRQGVRGSIIGRVERHNGSVRVTTAPDAGTEVEIRMPR